MAEREKAGTGSGGSGFGDTAGGNPCENESADYPSMSEGLTFFCETMTDGTGRYYTRKGTERVNPKGYLPKGIRVDGGKASLRFRKDGFAGTGEEYNIFLTTDNGKYGRMITVAMYTGRVRVRK